MAVTWNHGPGKGTTSGETVTANGAGSTNTRFVTGPARDKTAYGGKVSGRYIQEIGGSNGIYRWIEDFPVGVFGTPATGFTADNV